MATAPFDPALVESQVHAWLAGLRLGSAQTMGSLTVTPLLHPSADRRGDLLSHDALSAGVLDVLEKDGGVVQELLARNKGDRPIVIVEGETLIGARQNRVIAHTVVVGPGTDVVVPVGCVEQGRWRFTSERFESGAAPTDWKLRRGIKTSVLRTRSSTGRTALDQQALWSHVAQEMDDAAVASETSDYHELIQRRNAAAEDMTSHLRTVDGQVGILVLADGQLVVLELAGSEETWRHLAGRALASLVPAASDPALRRKRGGGRRQSPDEWLASISAARVVVRPATGLGADVEIVTASTVGSGVWLEGRPAHLSVFAPA